MNYYKRWPLLVLFISTTILCEEKKIFVIKMDNAGLFACFFSVLNNIAWCEKNGSIPSVYWGKQSLYYEPTGYHGMKDNVWEYYFKPISHISYKTTTKKSKTRSWQSYRAPDQSGIPGPMSPHYDLILDPVYRQKMHNYIKRYITINSWILDKVDAFYTKQMKDTKTIGIHLRGTDKHLEVKYDSTIKDICQAANMLAASIATQYQFLVATDEESLLQQAKKLLNGPVIAYDSYRSHNGKPIHESKEHSYNRAKMGEEVLVESLLLSKCDAFVHTRSNVSTAVLFFNPELASKVLY